MQIGVSIELVCVKSVKHESRVQGGGLQTHFPLWHSIINPSPHINLVLALHQSADEHGILTWHYPPMHTVFGG